MSNQKITEFKSLSASTIDDADLFPVVDVSSNASPTGETKNISTGQLVARIINSSIDQINQTLGDTAKLQHSHSIDDVIDLRTTLNTFISSSQIGQGDGVAPLGADGKINQAYLPDSISGSNFVRTIFGREGNVTASVSDYEDFYILATQVGQPNGVAGLDATQKIDVFNLPTGTPLGIPNLDATGKVPLSQLPDIVTGSFPVTDFNGRTGAVAPQSSDYSSFYVSQSGGTLTGPLSIPITPTLPSHSVSKFYVDSLTGLYVPLSGGTMSGALSVQITPTLPSHSVSKQYVDSIVSVSGFGVKGFANSEDSDSRMNWDAFAFIDNEDNARVIGNNSFPTGRFGQYNDANSPGLTLNLPDGERAEKLYVNRYNTIVLSKTNLVYGMGYNHAGQLGITGVFGSNIKKPTLMSLTGIVKVAFSCDEDVGSYMFLTDTGTVYSAGANSRGQLGIGTTSPTNASGPTLTIGPGNTYGNPTLPVSDIIGFGSNSLPTSGPYEETYVALLNNGTVWCVGDGSKGQMGNGTTTATNSTWQQVTKVDTTALTDIEEIKIVGQDASLTIYAKTTDNKLYGWGDNTGGQLGDGTVVTKTRAVLIDSDCVDFWAFGSRACLFIKRSDGNIYSCGNNTYGQLGIGTIVNTPTLTNCVSLNGRNIQNLYSGCHSYGPSTVWAKGVSDDIYVTGYNGQGQHGLGDQTDRRSFEQVYFNAKSPIVDINSQYTSAVGGYTYILTADGNIYHTGQSRFGWGTSTGNRSFFSKTTGFVVG